MNIQNQIVQCLSNVGISVSDINESEDLRLLGMDSLQIVLLITELEKTFQFKFKLETFKEEDFYHLHSIKKIVNEHIS
jgi:acyl carrier protein